MTSPNWIPRATLPSIRCTASGQWLVHQTMPFLLTNSKLSALQRIKRAARRIPIFLAIWIAAFLILPTNWVATAAVAYGIWLIPIVVMIYKGLQHIGEPESNESRESV